MLLQKASKGRQSKKLTMWAPGRRELEEGSVMFRTQKRSPVCMPMQSVSPIASRGPSNPPENKEAFEMFSRTMSAELPSLCSVRVGKKGAYWQLFPTDGSTPVWVLAHLQSLLVVPFPRPHPDL